MNETIPILPGLSPLADTASSATAAPAAEADRFKDIGCLGNLRCLSARDLLLSFFYDPNRQFHPRLAEV